MKMITWRDRLRYQFDKSMAAGPIALIGWLAVISLIVIIFAGLFLALSGIAPEGGAPVSFIEGAWESLMRTMDAGTMGGDAGWSFRGVSLVVTVAGIFVFSALIGVLSSGLDEKLDDLRKGRSHVLEKEHTIIFNWSPSIFDVISELVIANESRRNPRIVIMASKDKVEMEDEIADKIADLGNTRIICRSGDPTDLYDVNIVNPQASRSIIVLSPESDYADSEVIKTVLALVNDPDRRKEPYQIAAEIRDARNAEVARIVGGSELQLVLADELISRIVVSSSRQAGLSAVYTELLDFDGSEIYAIEQETDLQVKATCAPHYYRILRQEARKQGRPISKVGGHPGGHPGAPGHPGRHPGGDAALHSVTRGCLAGTAVCFVSHEGKVFPCGYLPAEAGDVRKQTFGEIWTSSPVFADLRDPSKLTGKCGGCPFKTVCGGCRARAFYETGNYLDEEPYCAFEAGDKM